MTYAEEHFRLQVQRRMLIERFFEMLSDEQFSILKTIPKAQFAANLVLLVSRRVGEGELDIFCGYHRDDEKFYAVYVSLSFSEPILLLERKMVEERIENMKNQNLPYEQSQQALVGWPFSC